MRSFFCTYLLCLMVLVATGQQQVTPKQAIDIVDLSKVILPPLDTLFENAKKSPSVEMYEAKMEVQDNQLTSEQRSWLKYFRVGGSWQYGNIAVNSAFTNEFTPLFYQSSGVTQSSWYGTAGVNVPLDDLFDRGNRVKRQKMERRFTELERAKWLDEQKIRIVNSYLSAKAAIQTLQKKVEEYHIAEANYKMLENEFRLGNATITDLSTAKKLETEAFDILKMNEYKIRNEVLILEILSNTKIISF
ncbi:TolC family protein [Sphingobacterium hotanense]|uniref:TolC family protein n=1 Tax=Sphingobacterium hotanense TaxID=649196 RepID=A0ABT7NHI4_9SPHI|nr:TolC family protein [Sphingobacterium hotanense]MDM1046654.1 TolC family protein [Sphingobacterium hotanense]